VVNKNNIFNILVALALVISITPMAYSASSKRPVIKGVSGSLKTREDFILQYGARAQLQKRNSGSSQIAVEVVDSDEVYKIDGIDHLAATGWENKKRLDVLIPLDLMEELVKKRGSRIGYDEVLLVKLNLNPTSLLKTPSNAKKEDKPPYLFVATEVNISPCDYN
jgi:hypothetical protein